MEKTKCSKCEKTFLSYRSQKRKFCSRECFYSSDYLSKYKKTKPNVVCRECGKHFRVKPSWTDERVYCSKKCANIGQSRKVAWNKGKKLSKKHRENLSISNSGKSRRGTPHSLETKIKISMASRKQKVKKFDGFIKTKDKLERKRFREIVQKQVFERDDYTCQMCEERGGSLQVDHIQPWAEYVELRFDINNCRTLCMSCHYYITFGKKKPDDVIWGHNLKYTMES